MKNLSRALILVIFLSSLFRPDVINYGRLRPNQHEANLNNAFNVAEEILGITKLLDAEGNKALKV